MKNLLYAFLATALIIQFAGCDEKEDENITGNQGTIKSLTINHFGVDWSLGKTDDFTDPAFVTDGDVIAWCEYNTSGNFYGKGVWYRNEGGGNVENYYLAGSNIDLSTIAKVDTAKFRTVSDCVVAQLKNGDVWVCKVTDGFVKFKVVLAPMDSAQVAADPNWPVKVDYQFSKTTSF